MSTIRKRGNNYQIRVSCGYRVNGEQIIKTMTYKPLPGMTEKQIQKELKREAVIFEEKCLNGTIMSGNIKLGDFMEKWFKDYGEKQLKAKTFSTYKVLSERGKQALGHIAVSKIRPHHLIEFYNNLAESGVREDIKYKATEKLIKIIKCKALTVKQLSERTGVSENAIMNCKQGKNVSKGTADKITAYFNETGLFEPVNALKPLSGKTILHYHRFISSVLSAAVEWQIISSNPCQRVKPPKVEKKEAVYLDEVEAARLINCLDNEPLPFKTMIMLFLFSGMRRGELCGLEWSDIDFKNNLINISKSSLYLPEKGIFEDTTKNKTSERVIRVPQEMTELLKEYRKEQNKRRLMYGDMWKGSNKIFTGEDGRPIHPDTVSGQFNKFIKRYDLPPVHIHSLRHTNATLLIAAGTDIRTVAKRLGHATATTTANIYAHAIKTADELAAEKLADILHPINKAN